MLKIYENGVPEHPLMVRAPDWYIEHCYDGEDVLKFMIQDSHEAYKYIAEEVRITDGVNRYAPRGCSFHPQPFPFRLGRGLWTCHIPGNRLYHRP